MGQLPIAPLHPDWVAPCEINSGNGSFAAMCPCPTSLPQPIATGQPCIAQLQSEGVAHAANPLRLSPPCQWHSSPAGTGTVPVADPHGHRLSTPKLVLPWRTAVSCGRVSCQTVDTEVSADSARYSMFASTARQSKPGPLACAVVPRALFSEFASETDVGGCLAGRTCESECLHGNGTLFDGLVSEAAPPDGVFLESTSERDTELDSSMSVTLSALTSTLQRVWGPSNFRGRQLEVIMSAMSGKDVLSVLPTGAGKSLTYQLPAAHIPGLVMVVCPLIALMEDQCSGLHNAGVPSAWLGGKQSASHQQRLLDEVGDGVIRLLYVSPERVVSDFKSKVGIWSLLRKMHAQRKLHLFVVDEAHCVSQWGFDFRPLYSGLGCLKREHPEVPSLATTGTANERVRTDIMSVLHLRDVRVVLESHDRSNRFYSVIVRAKGSAVTMQILDVVRSELRKPSDAAIIYVHTRKRSAQLVKIMVRAVCNAGLYHGGLSARKRSAAYEQWSQGHTPVIVCTTAFGMGIDHRGVRVVVHAATPLALDSYAQEAGRGGRDGQSAKSVVLFCRGDVGAAKDSGLLQSNAKLGRPWQRPNSLSRVPLVGVDSCWHILARDLVSRCALDVTCARVCMVGWRRPPFRVRLVSWPGLAFLTHVHSATEPCC